VGLQASRSFGTTLQDVLSESTPAHKDFLDNRTHGGARGHDTRGGKGRGKKGRDSKREREIQKENIEKAQKKVSDVFTSLSKTTAKKVYTKDKTPGEGDTAPKIINVSAFISIGELAGLLEIPSAEIIKKCMEIDKKLMPTINKRLDFDTVELIADEFGFKAQLMEEYQEETLGTQSDDVENLKSRHPVVTVMGHVDHGGLHPQNQRCAWRIWRHNPAHRCL